MASKKTASKPSKRTPGWSSGFSGDRTAQEVSDQTGPGAGPVYTKEEYAKQRAEKLARLKKQIDRLWELSNERFVRVLDRRLEAFERGLTERLASVGADLANHDNSIDGLDKRIREVDQLAAPDAVLQDTRRQVDALRAELRSPDPKTPGMLQLVPGLYEESARHGQRIGKLELALRSCVSDQALNGLSESVKVLAQEFDKQGRDLEALRTALQIVRVPYQVTPQPVSGGMAKTGHDAAREAAARYATEPTANPDLHTSETWVARREAFVDGYNRALADMEKR